MLILSYFCESTFHQQNETFFLCNCTMAKCIENNTIEIVPYECPPLQNITCTNGKKPVLVYDEYYCCEYYVCDCKCLSCKLNYLLFFAFTFLNIFGSIFRCVWRLGRSTLHHIWWVVLQLPRKLYICLGGRDFTTSWFKNIYWQCPLWSDWGCLLPTIDNCIV